MYKLHNFVFIAREASTKTIAIIFLFFVRNDYADEIHKAKKNSWHRILNKYNKF